MFASRHLNGALKTVKYHGQKRETQVAVIEDSDIVITTYHTLAADFVAKASPLNEIAWFRVVLDEGMELQDSILHSGRLKTSRQKKTDLYLQLILSAGNPPPFTGQFPS